MVTCCCRRRAGWEMVGLIYGAHEKCRRKCVWNGGEATVSERVRREGRGLLVPFNSGEYDYIVLESSSRFDEE